MLVAYGDTPLLRGESLRDFAAEHEAAQRAVSILSGIVADPFGYGRVLRNDEGDVEAIVEEKDATRAQREVREINSGILAFDAEFLIDGAAAAGQRQLQGRVLPHRHDRPGPRGRADRRRAPDRRRDADRGRQRPGPAGQLGAELNRRIVEGWMREGVTVMDPATTWIDADVVLAPDVTILPGTQLLGATVVASDAVIGPDTTLKDCEVGAGARVVRTHGELAVIGDEANVGPFAYLRPGTNLGARGKIGAFVETKNAVIGDGAKVPHLSYVGDAEIGEGANIGAGTIFANYDGTAKHRTKVGKHAKTGSNNTFVAPVEIGDGAGTGGGTVVREDVPPGALAVSAGPQRNIEGWAVAKRAGHPAGGGRGGCHGHPSGRCQTWKNPE